MNKLLIKILLNEMAEPVIRQKNKIYYHGTNDKDKMISIIKNGLKAGQISIYSKTLKPIKGMVYLTESLRTALNYADEGDNDICVLVFDGIDLKDVYPDEDSLGLILNDVLNSRDDKYNLEDLEWLKHKARKYLKGDDWNSMRHPSSCIFDLAPIAKKFMKHLTDEEIQKILEISKNIAHKGVIIPKQGWYISSDEWNDIEMNYNLFFDNATKYENI